MSQDREHPPGRSRSFRELARKVREKGLAGCYESLFWHFPPYPPRLTAALLRRLGVRFLPFYTERIGHLASEPDTYYKEGVLDGRRRQLSVVLAPPHRVANPALLDYWRPYYTVIHSRLASALLMRLSHEPAVCVDLLPYVVSFNHTARFYEIQRRWGDRPPLLTLTEAHRSRGRERLRRLGMPDDAWFVCVHNREPGYIRDGNLSDHRDADIRNYMPAMREVVERGGWCVRIGDPTMTPLPPMERVIDYPHSDARSDWMDVFLIASCRFFLGCSSGPYMLAAVFGVPVACANQVPPSVVLPWGGRDIGIPKLLWSHSAGRFITFAEAFVSEIGNNRLAHVYAEHGVEAVENSADEIRDLAVEMLERIDGTVNYTPEDEELQQRFKSFMKPRDYSSGSESRVGRDFLRKYASVVGPDSEGRHLMIDRQRGSPDSTDHPRTPLLSIGLPVYNGGRFLRGALDSLLGQDFADFELIISDNCSTDDTADICLEYARRDTRVSYSRTEKNLGAVPNFNRVFGMARGRFFAWASHDDLWEPSYFRCCVEAVQSKPGAVLAHTMTRIINLEGIQTAGPIGGLFTESLDSGGRFRTIIREAYAPLIFYGVMRADVLRETGRYRNFLGGDNVLLAELAFLGSFVEVPEALRSYRIAVLDQTVAEYWSRIKRDLLLRRTLSALFPRTFLCGSYIGVAIRAPVSVFVRVRSVGDALFWYGRDVIVLASVRSLASRLLGSRRFERVQARLRKWAWYRRFRRIPDSPSIGPVPSG